MADNIAIAMDAHPAIEIRPSAVVADTDVTNIQDKLNKTSI